MIKSIVFSAGVVKTNLTNLIDKMQPEKLEKEFPADIAARFRYIYFAEDSERLDNGNVVPGVGGDVYLRLGFKNQEDKNRFSPDLVKARRKSFLHAA